MTQALIPIDASSRGAQASPVRTSTPREPSQAEPKRKEKTESPATRLFTSTLRSARERQQPARESEPAQAPAAQSTPVRAESAPSEAIAHSEDEAVAADAPPNSESPDVEESVPVDSSAVDPSSSVVVATAAEAVAPVSLAQNQAVVREVNVSSIPAQPDLQPAPAALAGTASTSELQPSTPKVTPPYATPSQASAPTATALPVESLPQESSPAPEQPAATKPTPQANVPAQVSVAKTRTWLSTNADGASDVEPAALAVSDAVAPVRSQEARAESGPVKPLPALSTPTDDALPVSEAQPKHQESPRQQSSAPVAQDSPAPSAAPAPAPRVAEPTATVESKPATLSSPPSSEPPPAPRLVARGLSAALAQRGGVIHVKLIPASLGEVRIQMNLEPGAVSVRIDASTTAAQHLLSDHLGVLRQTLESRGLQVDRLTVSLAPTPHAAPTPTANQNSSNQNFDQTSSQQQRHDSAGSQSRGRSDDQPSPQRFGAGAYGSEDESSATPGSFDGRLRLNLAAVA